MIKTCKDVVKIVCGVCGKAPPSSWGNHTCCPYCGTNCFWVRKLDTVVSPKARKPARGRKKR